MILQIFFQIDKIHFFAIIKVDLSSIYILDVLNLQVAKCNFTPCYFIRILVRLIPFSYHSKFNQEHFKIL